MKTISVGKLNKEEVKSKFVFIRNNLLF